MGGGFFIYSSIKCKEINKNVSTINKSEINMTTGSYRPVS